MMIDNFRMMIDLDQLRAEQTERKANPPKHIDNASLRKGAPMYYYCRTCGHNSDTRNENDFSPVRRVCYACQWLTMAERGIVSTPMPDC